MLRSFLTFLLVACSFTATLAGTSRATAADFERDVLPILIRRCAGCHGETKREAGLQLHHPAALQTGSDHGSILAGKEITQSRLWLALFGGSDEISRMPPEGSPLEPAELGTLRSWLESGAALPATKSSAASVSQHWAFRAPRRPPLPPIATSSDHAALSHPIDAFILERLAAEGGTPSPEADRATLLRRVSLDLLGLLPSPEDVDDFLRDPRPDAYLRVVDRLLANPAYGERWGRHWLDAARYADSNGYTRDFGREIWKYREWVLAALNADVPFDQFTIEQMAGDMLPNATLDQRIATGFHRNTLFNEEGGTDPEQFRVDAVADRVATTGEVYLGLTLLCARCHTHKYDPVSQREFYQVFAFLNHCDEPVLEAPSPWQVARGELEKRQQIRDQIAALEKEIETQRSVLEEKQRAWEATVTPQQRARLPGPVQVAYDMPFDKRDAANKKTIEDYYRQSEDARRDFPALQTIAELREREPKIPTTLVMAERTEPRKTHVHRRGDFLDLGDEVTPGVPAFLHPLKAGGTTANRLDFARWLVDPANPLTPRVLANRAWLQFFGRGLVETENDFGTQGSPPTHPELLDWLAVEWVEGGWSMKQLHRSIVMSATYRQSSARAASGESGEPTEVATARFAWAKENDPDNVWLWRQNRVRLEAEVIRDVALSASGLLTHKLGGPSVFPPQPEGVFEFTQDPKPWKVATGDDRYRRGLYTHFWRSSPYPAMMVFDAPSGNISCTRRLRSNTPLQALTLANDVQFVECAQALADRVLAEGSAEVAKRAEYAFRICFAREPSSAEQERLLSLVHQQLGATSSAANAGDSDAVKERGAWTAVSRVLLNLDEFITRE